MKKISVTIGSECDDNLKSALISALTDFDAKKINEDIFYAGSQEILKYEFTINEELLEVELETYMGITIHGDEKIIQNLVRKIDAYRKPS